MNYPKKQVSISTNRGIVTYRVKTWFLKILPVFKAVYKFTAVVKNTKTILTSVILMEEHKFSKHHNFFFLIRRGRKPVW